MIKVSYEAATSTFLIHNLTSGRELFRKRFYNKNAQLLKQMVVFACVRLLGYDCAVELVLDMCLE